MHKKITALYKSNRNEANTRAYYYSNFIQLITDGKKPNLLKLATWAAGNADREKYLTNFKQFHDELVNGGYAKVDSDGNFSFISDAKAKEIKDALLGHIANVTHNEDDFSEVIRKSNANKEYYTNIDEFLSNLDAVKLQDFLSKIPFVANRYSVKNLISLAQQAKANGVTSELTILNTFDGWKREVSQQPIKINRGEKSMFILQPIQKPLYDLDKDGNPKVDASGEPIFVLDAEGKKIIHKTFIKKHIFDVTQTDAFDKNYHVNNTIEFNLIDKSILLDELIKSIKETYEIDFIADSALKEDDNIKAALKEVTALFVSQNYINASQAQIVTNMLHKFYTNNYGRGVGDAVSTANIDDYEQFITQVLSAYKIIDTQLNSNEREHIRYIATKTDTVGNQVTSQLIKDSVDSKTKVATLSNIHISINDDVVFGDERFVVKGIGAKKIKLMQFDNRRVINTEWVDLKDSALITKVNREKIENSFNENYVKLKEADYIQEPIVQKPTISEHELERLRSMTAEELHTTNPEAVLQSLHLDYSFNNGRYIFKTREERTASANMYIGKTGEWKYKDFGGNNGTIENVVMDMTGMSLKDATVYSIDKLGTRDYVQERLNGLKDGVAIKQSIELSQAHIERIEKIKQSNLNIARETSSLSRVLSIKEIDTTDIQSLNFLRARGVENLPIPKGFYRIEGEVTTAEGKSFTNVGVGVLVGNIDNIDIGKLDLSTVGADIHLFDKVVLRDGKTLKTQSFGVKDITIINDKPDTKSVAVFESKMDYLVAADRGIIGDGTTIIIANGTGNYHKVAAELKENQSDKNVQCFNQNDIAGSVFITSIIEEAGIEKFDYINYTASEAGKDINDLVMSSVSIADRIVVGASLDDFQSYLQIKEQIKDINYTQDRHIVYVDGASAEVGNLKKVLDDEKTLYTDGILQKIKAHPSEFLVKTSKDNLGNAAYIFVDKNSFTLYDEQNGNIIAFKEPLKKAVADMFEEYKSISISEAELMKAPRVDATQEQEEKAHSITQTLFKSFEEVVPNENYIDDAVFKDEDVNAYVRANYESFTKEQRNYYQDTIDTIISGRTTGIAYDLGFSIDRAEEFRVHCSFEQSVNETNVIGATLFGIKDTLKEDMDSYFNRIVNSVDFRTYIKALDEDKFMVEKTFTLNSDVKIPLSLPSSSDFRKLEILSWKTEEEALGWWKESINSASNEQAKEMYENMLMQETTDMKLGSVIVSTKSIWKRINEYDVKKIADYLPSKEETLNIETPETIHISTQESDYYLTEKVDDKKAYGLKVDKTSLLDYQGEFNFDEIEKEHIVDVKEKAVVIKNDKENLSLDKKPMINIFGEEIFEGKNDTRYRLDNSYRSNEARLLIGWKTPEERNLHRYKHHVDFLTKDEFLALNKQYNTYTQDGDVKTAADSVMVDEADKGVQETAKEEEDILKIANERIENIVTAEDLTFVKSYILQLYQSGQVGEAKRDEFIDKADAKKVSGVGISDYFVASQKRYEIVDNVNNGVLINDNFTQWNNIKTEAEHAKWVSDSQLLRFGTFQTYVIEDLMQTFNAKTDNPLYESYMSELKRAYLEDNVTVQGKLSAETVSVSKELTVDEAEMSHAKSKRIFHNYIEENMLDYKAVDIEKAFDDFWDITKPQSMVDFQSFIESNKDSYEVEKSTSLNDEEIATLSNDIANVGSKTKFKNNIRAIDILAKVRGGEPLTKDDRTDLRKYVGWGGLPQAFYKGDGTTTKGWEKEAELLKSKLSEKEYEDARASTLNAHYTPLEVSQAMWKAIESFDFRGGAVLEPSVGTGNFLSTMPIRYRDKVSVDAVELDTLTAEIVRSVHADKSVYNMGFEDFKVPNDKYSLVIGNPPFGQQKLYDVDYNDLNLNIHNYFFAKSIDKLKEGGVLAMVVSNSFLDSANSGGRDYVGARARLVSAIRLPNNAFSKNAGTEVTTDILFFQKTSIQEKLNYKEWNGLGEINDTPINKYFERKPKNLLGTWGKFGTMYRGDEPALVAEDGQDTIKLLNDAISRIDNYLTDEDGNQVYDGLQTAKLMTLTDAYIEPKEQIFEGGEREADDKLNDYANGVKNGAMFVYEDKLYKKEGSKQISVDGKNKTVNVIKEVTTRFNSKFEEVELKDKEMERLKGMANLAMVANRLVDAQVDRFIAPSEVEVRRAELNTAYDAFVKEFGMTNNQTNRRLFEDDVNVSLLLALENDYEKEISAAVAKQTGEKARKEISKKADIFTQRTQYPYTRPSRANDIISAYQICLSEFGDIDEEYIVNLLAHENKSWDEIADYLIENNLIFETDGGYQTREEYLSGNVKHKALETTNPKNIAALKEVTPEDLEYHQITVKAGAVWLPREVMADFVKQITSDNDANAILIPFSGKWSISCKPTFEANSQYGTDKADLHRILDAFINSKQITITYKDADGNIKTDNEASLAANAKVETLKRVWDEWLWDSAERRDILPPIYNDKFNVFSTKGYDGSHLSLQGKVSDDIVTLRPHQKNAVWRNMITGKGLLDHTVGSGKTFTAISAVMEAVRTQRAKKPLVVVPNHITQQWGADFKKLYPNAKVLVPTEKDFTKQRRHLLFSKIQTGNWDAVVIGHSQLIKLENERDFELNFLNKDIAEIQFSIDLLRREEDKDSRSVKDLEKSLQNMQFKIKQMLEVKRDNGFTFDKLGIDYLVVDEAHEFKNLKFFTSMSRIKGLGNPEGSQKAFDLFLKVNYIQKMQHGKNVLFLTGTPISNSMAELYNIQKYLQYDELKEMGIIHFDSWAKQFTETVTDWELDATGRYKLSTRLAKFVNMPELMGMYNQFADIVNNEQIEDMLKKLNKTLGLPKIKGGKTQIVVVERSDNQADFFGEADSEGYYPRHSLVGRAEALSGKPEKGGDNHLVIMSDAKKASLDMRLIDDGYADYENNKINTMLNNAMALYKKWDEDKGVQLIFSDLGTPKDARKAEQKLIKELIEKSDNGDVDATEALEKYTSEEIGEALSENNFSVYVDIKQKLVALGIPEHEVAFIHDAKTPDQKAVLFGKVRSGNIRFLLGSTQKMGAGTNVQDKLVGLHHLDVPFRPSDIEQRNGRIIRQGNKLMEKYKDDFEIEMFVYCTEKTLDAKLWEIIEKKAKFIEQVKLGNMKDRDFEDVALESMTAGEIKALASGNPLILEEMTIKNDIKKLEAIKQSFLKSIHIKEAQLINIDRDLKKIPHAIELLEQDNQTYKESIKEHEGRVLFSMKIGDKLFEEHAEAPKNDLEPSPQVESLKKALDDEFGINNNPNIVMASMPKVEKTAKAEKVSQRVEAGKELLGKLFELKMNGARVDGVKVGEYCGFDIEISNNVSLLNPNLYKVSLMGADEHDIDVDMAANISPTGTMTKLENLLPRLERQVAQLKTDLEQKRELQPKLENVVKNRVFDEQEKLDLLMARHADIMKELYKKNDKKGNEKESSNDIQENGISSDNTALSTYQKKAQLPKSPLLDKEQVEDIYKTLSLMPKTYELDGMKVKPIGLKLFNHNKTAYIVEADRGSAEDEFAGSQTQALGYMYNDSNPESSEWGYINVDELVKLGFEKDLYFEDKFITTSGKVLKANEAFDGLIRENLPTNSHKEIGKIVDVNDFMGESEYRFDGKCLMVNTTLDRNDYLKLESLSASLGGEWNKKLNAIVFKDYNSALTMQSYIRGDVQAVLNESKERVLSVNSQIDTIDSDNDTAINKPNRQR